MCVCVSLHNEHMGELVDGWIDRISFHQVKWKYCFPLEMRRRVSPREEWKPLNKGGFPGLSLGVFKGFPAAPSFNSSMLMNRHVTGMKHLHCSWGGKYYNQYNTKLTWNRLQYINFPPFFSFTFFIQGLWCSLDKVLVAVPPSLHTNWVLIIGCRLRHSSSLQRLKEVLQLAGITL